MLTSKQIRKIAEFDAQYGPPEQSFSPSWHAENPVPEHAIGKIRTETHDSPSITVCLRYVTDGSGDLRLWNDKGQPLPAGVTFVD